LSSLLILCEPRFRSSQIQALIVNYHRWHCQINSACRRLDGRRCAICDVGDVILAACELRNTSCPLWLISAIGFFIFRPVTPQFAGNYCNKCSLELSGRKFSLTALDCASSGRQTFSLRLATAIASPAFALPVNATQSRDLELL
jgi:hypothetical protein